MTALIILTCIGALLILFVAGACRLAGAADDRADAVLHGQPPARSDDDQADRCFHVSHGEGE